VIIGLGHVARVGKDTAAAALSRDLGYVKVAFADKLRDLAYHVDPIVTPGSLETTNIGVGKGRLAWVVQGMGWDEAKVVYPEVREILQRLGVGARKVFGDDFWVRAALEGLDLNKANFVVSDVRFHNEADAIHALGGKLVRIDRPGYRAEGHISETALAHFEDWDAVITNTGPITDLEAEIVNLAKGWVE
jgi:hypothetical protein